MNRTLDFHKAKKTFLTVTLPDDEKILVRNPTKKIMDLMKELGEDFKALQDATNAGLSSDEVSEENYEALNRVYEMTARIMSNNVARKQITVEYLEDLLDLEDLIVFFSAYTDFINTLQDSVKN